MLTAITGWYWVGNSSRRQHLANWPNLNDQSAAITRFNLQLRGIGVVPFQDRNANWFTNAVACRALGDIAKENGYGLIRRTWPFVDKAQESLAVSVGLWFGAVPNHRNLGLFSLVTATELVKEIRPLILGYLFLHKLLSKNYHLAELAMLTGGHNNP
ncbi:MAG TPA: hypothetical protein VG722_06730 [Tepidisphaeraceae bacterium]|nr:hypothetical protein [Tepidisphaeraceae bacterium]